MEIRVTPHFLGVFWGQCLDHNSAPLRSFETKIWPSEAEFRGAGREIGPELWILDFGIEKIEIRVKKIKKIDEIVSTNSTFGSIFFWKIAISKSSWNFKTILEKMIFWRFFSSHFSLFFGQYFDIVDIKN